MAELPQIETLRHAEAPQRSEKPASRLATLVNIPFVTVVVLLVSFGLLVCWSATSVSESHSFSRQLMGVALGAACMAVVWRFDYRKLGSMTMFFLVASVVLILSPHIPGLGTDAGMGAKSWIKLGMQFQPGEFAKVTVVLFAASLVARYNGRLDNAREYCKVVGFLLVPFICIMTQPDLGTGLVYLFISATVLVMGGARLRFLLVTLGIAVALVACVFALDEVLKYQTDSGEWEYRLLKQYQRNRLLVFLNPDADLSGEGYNLAQAKIAIGSGGLFGVGLLNGTQAAYGYLPEAPTDFIFCVLCEELGFAGAFLLIGLYAALFFISLRIARSCGNLFGMLIVCAIVGMWLFQILENIGMTCGLMPITGIPLPFVSYGTSFMITNFVMLGLIGSVWSHDDALNSRRSPYAAAR